MESLGERLKRGREEKKISLDDVVQATKINKGILTAIENDQSDFLPPKVFVRGFIRNYARYVGLDEKELLDLYNETSVGKKAGATSEEVKAGEKIKLRPSYVFVILVVALAILLVYQFFLRNSFENKPGFAPQQKSSSEKAQIFSGDQTSIPKEEASLGAETSPVAGEESVLENRSSSAPFSSDEKTGVAEPPTTPSPAFPAPMHMQAKCYVTTWIGYVVDNGQPSQIFLFPGDEFAWEWKDKIELRLGNAGGIKVTVNGVPLKPLGKSGEVLSIVFGRDTVTFRGGEPQKLDLWKEEAGESHSSGVEKRP